MQEKASFGALLKRYRLAAGLSQEALAARAISDLERGINRTPRYDTLELLVTALPLSAQQRDVLRAAAYPALAPEGIPAPVLSDFPLASTPFIGREAELAQIEDYLDNPDCRP
jgi:transcriptional regulator with XRE-family HTH domain